MTMKTIIEPFKIKMIEPIKMTTLESRERILEEAGYNPFLIKASDVMIDLLTDSGTGAMSAKQWAGIMEGDESYAGAKSFYHFQETVQELTGFKHVIPTHQGRAAERILFGLIGKSGKFILNNSHFDTTRANIEYTGAVADDLPLDIARNPSIIDPFKGNMNTGKLRTYIEEKGPQNIPLVMMTITNNTNGGQPVSLANIRETSQICRKFKIPFFLDACRFAENAYFIKTREKGQENRSVKEIAQEMFGLSDGATMSGKKDGHVNMGGFLALNDDKLAEGARNMLILTEGFPTYGGLAGRDLEAFAIGLKEVLDENYLKYRVRTVEYTAEKLIKAGVPIMQPPGGHAVYIDAMQFLKHIPRSEFPGQALNCAIYVAGGIRGVEIGSVMFGRKGEYDGLELVRLALPRRVYTQSHMDYVCEVVIDVFKNRHIIGGLKMVYEAATLRHFTARFIRSKSKTIAINGQINAEVAGLENGQSDQPISQVRGNGMRKRRYTNDGFMTILDQVMIKKAEKMEAMDNKLKQMDKSDEAAHFGTLVADQIRDMPVSDCRSLQLQILQLINQFQDSKSKQPIFTDLY